MAANKRATKKRKTKKQQQQQEKMIWIGIGAFLSLFGLFGILKLGFLGTLVANIFRLVGGNTYLFLCVGMIGIGLWLMIKNKAAKVRPNHFFYGGLLLYLGVLIFLHALLFGRLESNDPAIIANTWSSLLIDLKAGRVAQNVGGGMIGAVLYAGTYFLLAQAGSYFVSVLLMIGGALIISPYTLQDRLDHFGRIKELAQQRYDANADKRTEREEQRQAKKRQKEENQAMKKAAILAEIQAEESQKNAVRPKTPGEKLAEQTKVEVPMETEQLSFVPINSFQESKDRDFEQPRVADAQPPKKKTIETDENEGELLEFDIPQDLEDEAYELPPSTLLDPGKPTDQSGEYKKIEKNIAVLEKTFESFGVDAKVVKASLGPSVTKFEIQPAIGVKVSKIVGLTDDIALALAAKDVRMEAPIPGKSLIGIEVPNDAISTVSFREVVEAQTPHPDHLLEVPLGRDISGRVQTADLSKMPHLLVAGSTGSGKSVAINGMITSILMQAKPHQVKLMMVDPKMVELNVYNGIPHLLTPVVTNPRKAAQALQKVVKEMEERYEKFAATGVRNITGYNEMIEERNQQTGEKHPILPFIVVIVDELADLMMVASNEVEDAIIRLAQMARAAGIHMILATQRPSVDVITGIIKANVPSRMAFAVSSGTDSRTIIDTNGAEKLLGRGDMLFLPMGENKPIRVQGAFISDHDVEAVVTFVTNQQGANYEEKMMVSDEEATTTQAEESQDELYDQAKELVVEMQTASVSLLQRRFRIGYNRAARLIDELEANGIIGPSEGSKPRKVYLESLEQTEQDADCYSPQENDE
ncbi:DNA translocase FtsK [Enterococcus italicus]|uniref:DNA translocase FtsK n=1 Tax=Enterococcus italicus TaxID=246144 RepID=UPI002074806B|nr:DNA translocase FtsK [Enterococcus italicus]MCM6931990.1 DNA translocase FtsK [Enterococcus italicus]